MFSYIRIRGPEALASGAFGGLPGSTLSELRAHGIDVQAIIEAQKKGLPYRSSTEVEEKGVPTTVVITVD